jgi:nucleoside-diphosphate-sugar epimerase
MSLDPDPNMVIPDAITGALTALKVAYSEPSVKRFVFTSSSSAATISLPDKPRTVVDEKSWAEGAVKAAWADPPYTMKRAGAVYAASKVQSEQAVWKYHEEHRRERPDLVVNTGKMPPRMNIELLVLISFSTAELQLGQIYRSRQTRLPE